MFRHFRIESRNNKTARIRAKPCMFRLPFKIYETVTNFKKLTVKKIKFNFFFNLKFLMKNIPHAPY